MVNEAADTSAQPIWLAGKASYRRSARAFFANRPRPRRRSV